MDHGKFDDLTRTLALGKSRRTVIKGFFGGVVGAIAVAGRPAYGALAQDVACNDATPCAQGICCAGICRDIECCIDNPDPNETCPVGTSCFEGVCDDVPCTDDAGCAAVGGMCCGGFCRDIECCIDNPDPNATCPEGTTCFEGQCDSPCEIQGCGDGLCCCEDGKRCSADCCETPVVVLPATGSGSASDWWSVGGRSGGWRRGGVSGGPQGAQPGNRHGRVTSVVPTEAEGPLWGLATASGPRETNLNNR